ncbi:MAG: hypothetical protein K9H84_03940 [Bacteroidales bacterium]|nr:hypothetical protein [Bacteroidales bacterium]
MKDKQGDFETVTFKLPVPPFRRTGEFINTRQAGRNFEKNDSRTMKKRAIKELLHLKRSQHSGHIKKLN